MKYKSKNRFTDTSTKNIRELLAGCRTMFLFAVFFNIGALERNAY